MSKTPDINRMLIYIYPVVLMYLVKKVYYNMGLNFHCFLNININNFKS